MPASNAVLYKSAIDDFYGKSVFFGVIFLVSIGLIMVASSSIDISQSRYGSPFFLFKKQVMLLIPGVLAAYLVYRLPMQLWQEFSGVLLGIGIVLLVLVLIPGVGREVNGSQRWISLGFATFQPSELCKVFVVLYMSAYLVRRQQAVRNQWKGFLIPIGIMSLLVLLLLLEPDFGSVVVLMLAVMTMLFLAGVKLQQFLVLISTCLVFSVIAASAATYRLKRLIAFTNPWEDQFGSGYQLTQSLIAFGRGEWLGVGLGESVQKLFYLPEAHTDFLFAILAEELGLFGSVTVIAVFSLVVWSGMQIGKRAEQRGRIFQAYVAYGLSMIIGVQAFINMGVCSGMLPTKGLTLPFMSYGGTSLAISMVMVGFLLRVNFEASNNLVKIEQKIKGGHSYLGKKLQLGEVSQ